MKNLLAMAIAAFSLSAFSQSYMIMDSGSVLTSDNAGFVYDFGHTAFPQRVTLKGGSFFVEDNSIIVTVDEMGNLFRKYEVIPETIIGKGINYFLSSQGELYTIDSKGMVHFIVDENLKRAVNFGGHYFTVATDDTNSTLDLYIINRDGVHVKAALPETLKIKDVVAFGGSYFVTNRGVLHTISLDGTVLAQPQVRVGVLQRRGGNYFTDTNGMFFTVAEDGMLQSPALPISLTISTMTKLGTNYFLDLSGRLFTVDKAGNVYERMMRDHDFRNARIISL